MDSILMKYLIIILLFSCVKAPIEDGRMITGKGRKIKPQKVIYLHFGDYYLDNKTWSEVPVYLTGSSFTEEEQNRIVDSVKWDFRNFDVLVTKDSNQYNIGDHQKRMRVVITKSYEWYGISGGVAYIGSFTWGDNTPCFVFASLLQHSVKQTHEAISHEAGHTLGLRHQALWENGVLVTPYKPADENGIAPIMGTSLVSIRGEWIVGPDPYGGIQKDSFMIAETLKKNVFNSSRLTRTREE
jgi:hypothetical protein